MQQQIFRFGDFQLDESLLELRRGGRVIEIQPHSDSRWEAFVATLPHSLIYHHPAWLQVLRESLACTPVHLACEDDRGRLWGVLPMMYKRGVFTGRTLSSLPDTPMAGPLASSDQALAALLTAAIEWVRVRDGVRLEVKVLMNMLDKVTDDAAGVAFRPTYQLELPAGKEFLHFGNAHAAI